MATVHVADGTPKPKRLKISEIEVVEKLCRNRIWVVACRGLIELYRIRKEDEDDGYLQDLREQMNNQKSWAYQKGFRMIATRCTSMTNDTPLYNKHNPKIPLVVAVRLVEYTTPLSRRTLTDELVDYLNDLSIPYDQRMSMTNANGFSSPTASLSNNSNIGRTPISPTRSPSKSPSKKNSAYSKNIGFDETPDYAEDLHPISDYIVSAQAVHLVTSIYATKYANKGWYVQFKEDAPLYFEGPPYPKVAVQCLGYPEF